MEKNIPTPSTRILNGKKTNGNQSAQVKTALQDGVDGDARHSWCWASTDFVLLGVLDKVSKRRPLSYRQA